MRKILPLLLLALILPVLPALAADTDLIETKVRLALAKIAPQIAAESEATPRHAERLAFAFELAEDPERWSRKFLGLVITLYPESANRCYADTLTGAVHCHNTATQEEVYQQCVAVLGTYLNLRASRTAQAAAALESAPAPIAETKAAVIRKP